MEARVFETTRERQINFMALKGRKKEATRWLLYLGKP